MNIPPLFYAEGYKYITRLDYVIQLNLRPPAEIKTKEFHLTLDGVLTIYPDYPWDGASGPALDSKDFMPGSLVHDVLYEIMRQGLLPQSFRSQADDELMRICLACGMSELRADVDHEGLALFGESAAALGSDPYPTIEAP